MTTRDRIRDAGAQMFRRNGYTGTGVKQVAAAAGAQLGSLYHFFPGGKEQLAEEVIRTSGPLYGDLVYAILDPYEDLETAITDAFALAAQELAASDYADACPIATTALEVASTNDHLRQATADVFTDWISRGAVLFARHGLDAPTARRLTIAMIAALEGAFVLARALRDPEPLHAAGASVATAVRQALDQAAKPAGRDAGRLHRRPQELPRHGQDPGGDRRHIVRLGLNDIPLRPNGRGVSSRFPASSACGEPFGGGSGGVGCAAQEIGQELQIRVLIPGADLVHRGVHAGVDLGRC